MQDINMYIAVFDHRSVCVPSSCCLLGNEAQLLVTEHVLLSRWWFVDMFLQSLVFLLRVCLKQWAFKCEIETARIVSTQVFWKIGSEFSNLLTHCSLWKVWTQESFCVEHIQLVVIESTVLWPGKQHVVNIAREQALLFGQAKWASREHASEGPRKGELATISHKFSLPLRKPWDSTKLSPQTSRRLEKWRPPVK